MSENVQLTAINKRKMKRGLKFRGVEGTIALSFPT